MNNSTSYSNEAKVGGLLVLTLALALFFAWMIGVENPFQASRTFFITYGFAGGIEVGSPIRVSGIKVGRVEKIEFLNSIHPNQMHETNPLIIPLKIKISIKKEAAFSVRHDSQFYINLAGIIGERYIEITPGHSHSPEIKDGEIVVGVDPPRIDQLISQSFNLAGKIKELIDENKGDITRSIELIYKLSGHLNQTLEWINKNPLFKDKLIQLTDNLIDITTDLRKITNELHSPHGKKTLHLLDELLWRLEPLNSKSIQDFFQKQGVRVHLF